MSFKDDEISKILAYLEEEKELSVYQNNIYSASIIDDNGAEAIQVVLSHNFESTTSFPILQERSDITSEVNPRGLTENTLDIGFATSIHINVVESGAGYNNTLGAYTIGADGTITAAKIAYTNVKDQLSIDKQINALEKNIGKFENKINGLEDQIAKSLSKIETAKNNKQVETEQKKIDANEQKIADLQKNIAEETSKIDALKATKGFTYDLDQANGDEIGMFIIADGDRKNNFDDLDLDNGSLDFIYNYGQTDQRAATIHDNAADISLVYSNGSQNKILSGYIYHTTQQNGSQNLNPDNAAHVIGGMSGEEGVYRLGFEDLRNLGDADFNDVVIDISVSNKTLNIPLSVLNNTVGTEGDDVLLNSQFVDEFDGKAGTDTADYSDDVAAITVDLREGYGIDGRGNRDTFVSIENLNATAYADIVNGSEGNNIIFGNDGNDRLYGRGGDDIIEGGLGDDYITGGKGNDILRGGDGNDILNGRDDNDFLYGGKGNDTLYGEAGNDYMYGGEGIDTVSYGVDLLAGAIGATFNGAIVNLALGTATDLKGFTDTLVSIENVIGSNYNDFITGNDEVNILTGEAGNDTLNGMGGNDFLNGGDGNDTLIGGAGADSLNGGAGIDTVDYSLDPAGINADLLKQTVTDGYGSVDSLFNIENIRGSSFADTIAGANTADQIFGGGGNDTIYGRSGDDILYGEAGNDQITGGDGNDIIIGGAGNDTLYGGSGADTFVFKETGYDHRDFLKDFNVAEGDKIDITDLLSGYDSATDDIHDFVQFNFASTSKSSLFVDTAGTGNFEVVATIQTNMNGATLDDLIANGTIII